LGGGGRGVRRKVCYSRNKNKKRKQHFFALVVLGFNIIPGCLYLLVNIGRTATCHTQRRKSVEGNRHNC
jgi:hypothetical protein